MKSPRNEYRFLKNILDVNSVYFLVSTGRIFFCLGCIMVLLRWLSGKQSTCQCRRHRSHAFNLQSLGWEVSPQGGNGNPSSILAWRILWTEEPGRLYSLWVCKSRTQFRDYTITITITTIIELVKTFPLGFS